MEEDRRERKLPYIDEGLIINTRLNELERQQREEKEEDRRYKARQLGFNLLLVIFTSLLFITSLTSDLILIRQTGSIKTSAEAARSAAGTASSALGLDQRAWIVAKYPAIQLHEGERLNVPLTLENIGKTLARRVKGDIAVSVLKRGQALDVSYVSGHPHYAFGPTGNFIPNTPDVRIWPALRDGQEIVLSKQLHNDIVSGQLLITVNGKIEYTDIFGNSHWLTFCQQTGGNGASASDECAAYNDIDSN